MTMSTTDCYVLLAMAIMLAADITISQWANRHPPALLPAKVIQDNTDDLDLATTEQLFAALHRRNAKYVIIRESFLGNPIEDEWPCVLEICGVPLNVVPKILKTTHREVVEKLRSQES